LLSKVVSLCPLSIAKTIKIISIFFLSKEKLGFVNYLFYVLLVKQMVRERKKGREEKHEYKRTLMYLFIGKTKIKPHILGQPLGSDVPAFISILRSIFLAFISNLGANLQPKNAQSWPPKIFLALTPSVIIKWARV
jgi:hypothetical protein